MWHSGTIKPRKETIHKSSFNVTRVTCSRATVREALLAQGHLKMRIARQIFKNMLGVKITSDTTNHLFSGRTVLAKTLKTAHTQISADPLAETRLVCKRTHCMSLVPIRHNLWSPKRSDGQGVALGTATRIVAKDRMTQTPHHFFLD